MKKLLSFLCVFLVSVAVLAQKQEVVWGYSGATIGIGYSVGESHPFTCAMLIPRSVLAQYKGCVITKIEVGNDHVVSELVPLISTGDENNLAKQAPREGVPGWNVIELETPYTISGAEDLYVGYECVTSYAPSGSIVGYTNGAYVFEDGEWSTASEMGAAFCIRAHIVGENMPIDVSLDSNEVLECNKGANLVVRPNVLNLSPEKVESVKFACYIDNEFSGNHEVKLDLEKGCIASADFSVTAPDAEGNHTVRVVVESVNGKADEIAVNNEVSIPVTVLGKTYPRRVVVEEMTGTWCGWCVRGYVALQEMVEKYPNDFIGLAYHVDDEMADAKNANDIVSMLGGSCPSCVVNRNMKTLFDCNPEKMENYVLSVKDLAVADIKGEMVVLDADTTKVMMKTYTEFATDGEQPYAIAYVVVENGVGPYAQANYYSGASSEFYGYEKQGKYVALVYDDVVRGVYGGAEGVDGSVPSEINQGQTYEYQYELTLPSNVKCKSNIAVVALLVNQENGQIANACKCSFDKSADAIVQIANTVRNSNEVYSLGGVRQSAPQRGFNLVRKTDGTIGKVLVK